MLFPLFHTCESRYSGIRKRHVPVCLFKLYSEAMHTVSVPCVNNCTALARVPFPQVVIEMWQKEFCLVYSRQMCNLVCHHGKDWTRDPHLFIAYTKMRFIMPGDKKQAWDVKSLMEVLSVSNMTLLIGYDSTLKVKVCSMLCFFVFYWRWGCGEWGGGRGRHRGQRN